MPWWKRLLYRLGLIALSEAGMELCMVRNFRFWDMMAEGQIAETEYIIRPTSKASQIK